MKEGKAMFIKQPFDEFLGLQYKRVNEDQINVYLPLQPLFLNSLGVVHGGIISSLADVAMCNVPEVDARGVQTVVTVDLKVSFLRPAKGEFLLADARVIKKGKSLIHSECLIYDDQNTLVAKADGILYVI
ncbi:PaaI family thioesterase [Polycladomyces subterraneus]|uniref:PaaI family thioesterase n=1 Tax=Polycladomyces subterraneus TaxID=1016997 RepID=A0ABT8INM7_9BACL|nr:PaaI family thioesterase [Polycladomyces subterraneus]MDN4594397.1 PaaI family thioesterase [Polycladomyces subterraneus]